MSLGAPQDDPPRRVVLLRHGRTAWNAQGRWQGREDISLDAAGLRQAERAAESLARDGSITSIVTSPARRAAQTAMVLKGALDIAGRPVSLREDPRLLEVDVGRWSGLTHDEVKDRFAQEYAAIQAGQDVAYGGHGERLSEASQRAQGAIVDASGAATSGDTIVIVMHGAVLRGAVAGLCDIPMDMFKRSFASIENCHWVTLVRGAGRWHVEAWNARA